MTAWTTKQDAILRELGHLGAAAVAEAIERELGVRRSVRSVECRASRIHVSLRVQAVCPECGVIGLRLNRQSGLCAKCTELLHLEEARAFNELLEAERAAAGDEAEIERLRRENAMVRKRNSRMCRKHGLPTMRERQRGGGDCGGDA